MVLSENRFPAPIRVEARLFSGSWSKLGKRGVGDVDIHVVAHDFGADCAGAPLAHLATSPTSWDGELFGGFLGILRP
jgi:hypothetical protein